MHEVQEVVKRMGQGDWARILSGMGLFAGIYASARLVLGLAGCDSAVAGVCCKRCCSKGSWVRGRFWAWNGQRIGLFGIDGCLFGARDKCGRVGGCTGVVCADYAGLRRMVRWSRDRRVAQAGQGLGLRGGKGQP